MQAHHSSFVEGTSVCLVLHTIVGNRCLTKQGVDFLNLVPFVQSWRRRSQRRTKAILVNSPHNPTGKVFSKEDLAIYCRPLPEMERLCNSR